VITEIFAGAADFCPPVAAGVPHAARPAAESVATDPVRVPVKTTERRVKRVLFMCLPS
jgi:hypothetical protein